MSKIAIMQPYFASHIGYFQLINDVDLFVLYDDVNFIQRGWINRNYITINKELKRFTIPLKGASQNKKINEVEVNWDCKDMNKLSKTLSRNLRGAAKEIIEAIFDDKPTTIADMAILSIKFICSHLNILTEFERSSSIDFKRQGDKALNLIEICKTKNIMNYVNAEGGQALYNKDEFMSHGVNLQFIKGLVGPSILEIIDSKDTIKMLEQYKYI
jgi:hypothetical protein